MLIVQHLTSYFVLVLIEVSMCQFIFCEKMSEENSMCLVSLSISELVEYNWNKSQIVYVPFILIP